jgi:hypothetical protein
MSEKHPYEAVGLRPDGDSFTVEVLGCQTEDEAKRLARHYADPWRRSVNLCRVPFVSISAPSRGPKTRCNSSPAWSQITARRNE